MQTFGYDPIAGQSQSFTYDGRGRMKQAGATTYLVNALGERVKKTTGAAETYFAYDEAGHLVGEYDATGGMYHL